MKYLTGLSRTGCLIRFWYQSQATAKLVREYQADLGVAWDGDFDRCFLFDEKAEFIEGII